MIGSSAPTQPKEYSRPDDRALLRASMRGLTHRFRSSVLFGGMVENNLLQLSEFLGTVTTSLHKVSVGPGAGLGGRVISQHRPYLVTDYLTSDGITHEYDFAVHNERIQSLAAVPIIVRGDPRSVLYLGSRGDAPLGQRALQEAMAAAAEIAAEVQIRDEVDRRVSVISQMQPAPTGGYDRTWLEHVRQAHAELRSLATTVADEKLAEQLSGIGSRLAPSSFTGKQPVPRLAPRELDVLAQLAMGCSYQETADRLVLKPVTVKSYLQNAMTKLSAHNRMEAVSIARRLGLLP